MKKAKQTKRIPNPDYNEVQVVGMKPNKMFPDWMHERVRGLHFIKAVACACCGKMKKTHWTMTMNFRAMKFEQEAQFRPFGAKCEQKVHLPFTPVCNDHPLEPIMPWLDDKKK